MKLWAVLILAVSVLAVAVVGSYRNYDQRESFASEVKGFMQKGGRNTALQGYNMCLRVNVHDVAFGLPPTDCCRTYFEDEDCDTMEEPTHE